MITLNNKFHYHFVFIITIFLIINFLSACSDDKKPPPPPPVPVLVGTVTERTVPVELKAIGNVEAYATVSIKSRVSGQLVQVNFKEGQDVKAGDLLFVIDPRPYEAALRQVEANLARDKALATKAQADARRYAELIRKQFVSQQEYDQAKATAESLAATVNAGQVAVHNAKLNLSYCYIKAPISGRTGSLIAHQGNMIKDNADTAMVVINQIQPIYVTFAIPEQNLAAVRKFMAAETRMALGWVESRTTTLTNSPGHRRLDSLVKVALHKMVPVVLSTVLSIKLRTPTSGVFSCPAMMASTLMVPAAINFRTAARSCSGMAKVT